MRRPSRTSEFDTRRTLLVFCHPVSSHPMERSVHRPVELAYFELVMTGVLLIRAVGVWDAWPSKAVEVFGSSLAITLHVFAIAVWLLLVLATSRKRSELAKWIIVVAFGLSSLGLPFYPEPLASISALDWLSMALSAVGCLLLFTPASRRWFKKAPQAAA